MCGIAGTIGLTRELADPALRRMQAALRHRGPDDAGIQFVGASLGPHPVGLAHTRLSIRDLSSAGHQPMESLAGGVHITFNGEIYNYKDLRAELESRGARFRSGTDTEVILNAYEAWGPASIERLRGMFAFALVDERRAAVWLCRDRVGQKPLYLARARDGLLFASEVRALLAVGPELVPPRVDHAAVASFLAQGMVCGGRSIVETVTPIPPAASVWFDFHGAEIERRRYWSIPRSDCDGGPSYAESVSQVREALIVSVADELLADVPLGLFLSGGIDSAAIATIATEVSPSKVTSVTIGFDDPDADESAEAQAVARELGTEHRTVMIRGADMIEDIDSAFAAMDQPTVDGFNTFFVARAARRAGLTVALSGLGGDELFGGYASFRDVPRAVVASRIVRRFAWAAPALATAARATGDRRGVKVAEMLGRMPDVVGAYLLRRELFLSAERGTLQSPTHETDVATGVPLSLLEELRALVDDDLTSTVSRFELALYTRDMLLRDADVFSMASALELRVPLLDDRLVDVVSRLPGRHKVGGPYAKSLLVDAAAPRFPRAVAERKKRGFAFPWDRWLRGALRARAQAALENEAAWAVLGFEPSEPGRLWRRYIERDPRVAALQIMALWVLAEHVTRHGLVAP